MRPTILPRTDLLTILGDAPGHVLLCAPSGFGKSVLLRQYRERQPEAPLVEARAGDGVEDLVARALGPGPAAGRGPLGGPGLRELLVDDAWLLSKEVVEALVVQAEEGGARLLLAVRHTRYPRVHGLQSRGRLLVLGAGDLAFTPEETRALSPEEGVYAETLGWPHLAAHLRDPLFSPPAYLHDLLLDLEPGLRARLDSVPMLEVWERHLEALRQRDDGAFEALMNTGLPIVPVDGQLHLHPYLWSYLISLGGTGAPAPLGQAETLLHSLRGLEDGAAAVEAYFEQHPDDVDETEATRQAKVALLRHVGLRHLTPELRDRLASLLIDVGQTDEAREVLAYQRDRGTASSRTYALLALLANFRNDFVEYKVMVPLIHQHAASDRDRARAYHYETLLHMRLNDYEAALRSAGPMYEYAVRSGNLEQHVRALARLSYCHQMMGHLDEAMAWAHEAIKLVSSELNPGKLSVLLSPVYLNLGDMLKDAGRHEEALNFVREALALHTQGAEAVQSSIGYLYSTRGLIYNELGRHGEAIESFEQAIEEFERVENRAGLLMPLTYICHPLYRLGQYERIGAYLNYLRLVVGRSLAVLAEYSEYQSYLPLAEGLYALGKGNVEEAAQALAGTRFAGAMTYDSVLLAQLYLCQLALRRGALLPEQVRRLTEVLDARGSGQDITAVMFSDEFRDVYAACARGGEQPERFARILATARQLLPSEVSHLLRLTTLGGTGLEINGQRVALSNNYPVYVLAYLALRQASVTPERLGDELWTDKPNSTATARSAVSMLRGVLKKADQELDAVMLESRPDLQGHMTVALRRHPSWEIEVDAAEHLSARFLPGHPDEAGLWTRLEGCRRFLPRATESRFAQEINAELTGRAHAVAAHLAGRCAARGEPRRAAHALLLALRCEVDLQAAERLEALAPDFDERGRAEIDRYLGLLRHPDTPDETLLRQAELTRASLFGDAPAATLTSGPGTAAQSRAPSPPERKTAS